MVICGKHIDYHTHMVICGRHTDYHTQMVICGKHIDYHTHMVICGRHTDYHTHMVICGRHTDCLQKWSEERSWAELCFNDIYLSPNCLYPMILPDYERKYKGCSQASLIRASLIRMPHNLNTVPGNLCYHFSIYNDSCFTIRTHLGTKLFG